MLGPESIKLVLSLLYLSVFLFDLGALNLRRLQVFGLSRILLAQKGTETDQVVLDQDVLLTQFFLADTAAFLLLLKLLFLVLERLLYLIHQSAFLEQSGSGADTIQLQRWWQLNFLIINHTCNVSSLNL